MTFRRAILAASLAVMAATAALAQGRRFFYDTPAPFDLPPNAKYDGRFTFARLKYTVGPGGYYYYGLPSWAHGYVSPRGGSRAEENLMKIMDEVSYLNARVEETVVLAVDDPELCKYPVAYMTEAGFWTLTDKEALALRAYLQKGGFLIVDDFRSDRRGGGGWDNFNANMTRVIPGARFVDMDAKHPIFHSFFEIDSLDIIPQAYDGGKPDIRGLYEDNDPNKRLMVIANHNTDVSEYWEFSATGFRPIEESNEAYKLGVNYIIYGMTH